MTSPLPVSWSDGAEASPPDSDSPSPFDAETLRLWQLELHDFVSHTRGRLSSLSASLTRWQDSQGTVEREATRFQDQNAGAPVEPIAETQRTPSAVEFRPTASEPVEPMPKRIPANDADPLTRLKLRLAQQIENA